MAGTGEIGDFRARCGLLAAMLLVLAGCQQSRSVVGGMPSPDSPATAFIAPYQDGTTRVMKADLDRLEDDIRRCLLELTWAAVQFQIVDRGAMGIPSSTPQAVYVHAKQANDQQVFILVNVLDDGQAEMAVRAGYFGDDRVEASFFDTFERVRRTEVWRKRLRVFRLPL